MTRPWVAAAVAALALLSFFQFPGHTWLQQDTQIYAPILEHQRDPALLRNELLAQYPHDGFTLYDEIAIALRRITGLGFREVLQFQQIVTRALGIWGLLLLAEAFGLATAAGPGGGRDLLVGSPHCGADGAHRGVRADAARLRPPADPLRDRTRRAAALHGRVGGGFRRVSSITPRLRFRSGSSSRSAGNGGRSRRWASRPWWCCYGSRPECRRIIGTADRIAGAAPTHADFVRLCLDCGRSRAS